MKLYQRFETIPMGIGFSGYKGQQHRLVNVNVNVPTREENLDDWYFEIFLSPNPKKYAEF